MSSGHVASDLEEDKVEWSSDPFSRVPGISRLPLLPGSVIASQLRLAA
jgi:hypothetical protein